MRQLLNRIASIVEGFITELFYDKKYDKDRIKDYIKIIWKVTWTQRDRKRFLGFSMWSNLPSSSRYRSWFWYRVIAKYTDKKTKKTYVFKSWYFDICKNEWTSITTETPLWQFWNGNKTIYDLAKIWDNVEISIDPKDYSNYLIDISQFLKKETSAS